MILILTDKNDMHANMLIKKLENDGTAFFRLNLDTFSLERTLVTFKRGSWLIKAKRKQLNLDEVRSVWNRKTFVQLMLDEQDNGHEFNIWKNEWNKTLLGIYYYLRNIKWINYYRNNHKAENKYYRLGIAQELGLKIPDYLLSNDRKEVLLFAKKHPKIVMKLMNQDFYKIGKGEFLGFYVNIISYDKLLEFSAKEENPIFLQKYVEKEFEVRYTVVGDEHFVCKIDSQKSDISKIDWRRYDLQNTPHSIISPPQEIKQAVSAMMEKLNLVYGALDFIVTPSGNWFFLEINPSGQYLWIEDLTGLKISDAIKKKLVDL